MARLVLSLSLVVATVLGGLGLHAVRDQHQLVDAPRLQAALLTFRPTGRAGSAKPVDAAGLSPERSTRTEPAHCRSLALLNTGDALDGGSWQGINGDPGPAGDDPLRSISQCRRYPAALRRSGSP